MREILERTIRLLIFRLGFDGCMPLRVVVYGISPISQLPKVVTKSKRQNSVIRALDASTLPAVTKVNKARSTP
jgi:hypothetical protein